MNLMMPIEKRDQLIKKGKLSWKSWLDAVEEHIRKTNGRYRGLVKWQPIERSDHGELPNLLVTYKDTIDIQGFPTRLGSRCYRHIPDRSAIVADRLHERRFSCLGKAWTTEFSLGPKCECVNPLYPDFSAGGSSTGSAVSVAAGYCDVSIGTDSAGSVRWPAGYCGVVGLRLTQSPQMSDGVFSVSKSMDSMGIMTRTVADLEYIWKRERLGEIFQSEAKLHSFDRRFLKIGVVDNYKEDPCHPEIQHCFSKLVDSLMEEGIVVRKENLRWWKYREEAFQLLWREVWDRHKTLRQTASVDYGPGIWYLVKQGSQIDDVRYEHLKKVQKQVASMAMHDLSNNEMDVWILPLDPVPPRNLRTPPTPVEELYSDLSYTITASQAVIPALTLPMGLTSDGAPMGLQIWAKPGGEEMLILAGRIIEELVRSSFSQIQEAMI
ncbi:amidase [Desmospora profundinema]|uniref:Aspartyl-tRNA(Asn)/glutamyl-tRNA(Gln) amidotransferase subunit A n=1 Tax=Desmospora profundinema TaxID=1571184 RepID=A0ABU1IP86_9BACL|nr:amidase [Desmospora profundinema]MDR6226588.1 aspartyl-tRNA(Asn)/glutamyl-tRNA(Gln) amidotransferase subunit A [Desmospora profundinema]